MSIAFPSSARQPAISVTNWRAWWAPAASKLRPGGLLIVDNALWYGRMSDEGDSSPGTQSVRDFTALITADPGWITMLVPIRDGMLFAYKK